MSRDSRAVTVHILDREYRVSCQPGEEQALRDSADLLNQRMREIRETGRVVGADRIAVMAALNLAREVMEKQTLSEQAEKQMQLRLERLDELLDGAEGQPLK